ncbi:hypothetical protein HQ535_07120 [bacterium]|nr:hypothetical protein [bacterium]
MAASRARLGETPLPDLIDGPRDHSSLSRGSALIEIIVLGVFIGVVLLTAIGAAARVLEAGSRASDAAEMAATAMALGSGDDRARALAAAIAPDAESVSITEVGGNFAVIVTIRVGLIGPDGGPVSSIVTGRAIAAPSPHVSSSG